MSDEELMTEEAPVDADVVDVVDVEVIGDEDGGFQEPTTESVVRAVPAKTGTSTATGRRKEAVARVRITPGSGTWTINGRTLAEYFPDQVHQQLVSSPFVTTNSVEHYDVTARIEGGGISGQAGALRMGISRALNAIDEEAHRGLLKKAGFLTRDPRAKERKKYGLKKARKAPQYSKR